INFYSFIFMFFFFQAEDGIRDRNVTGVQTCALPISASIGSFLVMMAVIAASFRMKNTMAILIIGIMFAALTGAIVNVLSYFSPRSEERRVGKECIYRWLAGTYIEINIDTQMNVPSNT